MRAALVTGASARIGLAIAEALARANYAVLLHSSARSHGRALAEAERLRAKGGDVDVLVADLAEPQACRHLVREAARKRGRLDLLVNNAALFESDAFGSLDAALWDRQFAVNLRAPLLLGESFAALASGGGGSEVDRAIVNIIDQRALHPTPQHLSYTLSKCALWTATQLAAVALAPQRIRVNAVGPGPVLANQLDGEAGLKREIAALPLEGAIAPSAIADAVLFLAAARHVTGQFIAVDGGQHLADAPGASDGHGSGKGLIEDR